MTFTQLIAKFKNFLMSWLLVLRLKESLLECATVCGKSEVILIVNIEYCFIHNNIKYQYVSTSTSKYQGIYFFWPNYIIQSESLTLSK